jgi:hypothetical protein
LFKVVAGSVDEYFRFDPDREGELRAIDALIRAAAPSLYTVKSSTPPIRWPVLEALAEMIGAIEAGLAAGELTVT